jgi:hypothetical protein
MNTLQALHDAHDHLPPFHTEYRIAYHFPGIDTVKIVHPDPRFMAKLMAGWIIARLRVVGANADTSPILDGDGKIMGPMSEMEALEFIRWKDIPREVNRWQIIKASEIPTDRTFRNAWRLAA